jgi:hypothetical protein
MSKKKPLVPFSMTPASWGLKGTSRLIAEAEYTLTGIELERRLAEIKLSDAELSRELAAIELRHNLIDAYTYDHRLLEIEGKGDDSLEVLKLGLKHLRMTQYEFDLAEAKLRHPRKSRERELALLEVEHRNDRIADNDYAEKRVEIEHPEEGPDRDRAMLEVKHSLGKVDDYDYALKLAALDYPEGKERDRIILDIKFKAGKVDEHEFEKEIATLDESPWVRVVDSGFDPEQGPTGVYFEFDWNEYMILYLRMNGYSGPTEASIIDSWFTDLCRAQGVAATTGNPFEVVPFGKM